tara:strand:+ start:4146 stop:4418 length:273 start_codon:yes stop_codon:yes gene_type:complete
MANSINGYDTLPHGYEFTITVDESIADSVNLENVVLRFTFQTETPTQEEIDAKVEIWKKRTEYEQQMEQAEEVAKSDMYLTFEERQLRGY